MSDTVSETGHSAERERVMEELRDSVETVIRQVIGNARLRLEEPSPRPYADSIIVAFNRAAALLAAPAPAGGTQPSGGPERVWICPDVDAGLDGDLYAWPTLAAARRGHGKQAPLVEYVRAAGSEQPRTLPTREQVEALRLSPYAMGSKNFNTAIDMVLALFAAAPIAEKGEG